MIMADILKIFLIIVGLLTVYVSYWLVAQALFQLLGRFSGVPALHGFCRYSIMAWRWARFDSTRRVFNASPALRCWSARSGSLSPV